MLGLVFVRMIMMDRGGRTKRERERLWIPTREEFAIEIINLYVNSFQATAHESKGEYFSLHAASREKKSKD